MAIQAQMYPENLGLPLLGGGNGGVGGGVSQQDWLLLANTQINNTNNNFLNGCGFNEFSGVNNNNLQQQKQQQQFQYQQQQQQQQQALLQLQQQYLAQLQQQQQQQRDSCVSNNINNDGFVFLSSSKNCTTTTTATTPTASTTTSGSCDYQMPMNFSPSFSDQLEKQRQEIDRFITLQNERLKMTLQEQRKQQLGALMRKLEAKAMQIMREKDEEIARATKRTMDLEEIIRKMEIENLEWQRLATENEAMVYTLNNTLVQLKEQQQAGCLTTTSSSCCSNEVDDAESCCNVVVDEFSNKKRKREETGVVAAETGEKREKTGEVLCKVCKTGESCVLLLPCRHLCCCKGCEAFVDVCPVCKSVKMASIEALIS